MRYILFVILFGGFLVSAELKYLSVGDKKIPVIYEQQDLLPTFNLQLVFKDSGYISDDSKSGLATLSAKLLNEGTKSDGAIKFARKLEDKAISIGVQNGFETMVVELSSLSSEYDSAINLLNKLLKDPNYTQDTLSKIKTTHLGKLKRKENDFDFIAKNNLKELLFKGTPLANKENGTIKSIPKISLDDIKENLDSVLSIDNLIIVAGGDKDYDEFKSSIKKTLKILDKKSSQKPRDQKINVVSKNKEKIVYKDTEQAYIYFGSPFDLDAKDEDVYKAKVASFILGGSGFGSRLMEEIRVKRGLAYSAYGYISMNNLYTYFTGYLQTKLESADEAKNLVKDIVKEFVKKGVTKKELEGAKNFLTGSEPLRVETLSQRQSRAFSLFFKDLPFDHSKKELELIESLSLEELNSFIKKHSEIEDLSFSIVTKK